MSRTGKFLLVIAILAAVLAILAVPGSLYFEEGTAKGTLLWTAAAAAAIAIGFAFSSFLFKAAKPQKQDLVLPEERQTVIKEEKKPLPTWARVLLAVFGLGAAAGTLFIPSSSYFSGEGPEAIWALGVVAALALGLALVRWLLNQGFMNDDDTGLDQYGDFDDYSVAAPLPQEESAPNYILWFVVSALMAAFTAVITITNLGDDYPVLFFVAVVCAMGAGIILALLATRKMDEIDRRPVVRDWNSPVSTAVPSPAKAASPAVRWGAFVILAIAAVTMVAVPTTSFLGEQGEFTVWSFLSSGAAMLIGLGLGVWLLQQAMAAAEKSSADDEFAEEEISAEPVEEAPSWKRHILLVLSIVLALFTGAVPAAEYYTSGRAYSTGWFLAALAALAVGAMFGYWLKLQAEAAAYKERQALDPSEKFKEEKPFVFPPWAKWVALAGLLILMVVVALLGTRAGYYTGTGSSWLEIVLAVLGIFGGVGIGIWFTKHFDQMAKEAYEQRRKNLSGVVQEPPPAYLNNSDDKFERK